MRKTYILTFGLCAALLVPAAADAQVIWTLAAGSNGPIQTTIAGGPWTLAQGAPYVDDSSGTTISGGPVTGTTPYCSNGTPISNSTTVVNTTAPYYFPFVSGSGNTLQGYFDYRPESIDEAIVAAISTNGGQSWTFENQIETLNTICPYNDTNSGNGSNIGAGNDDGVGHPYVINFAGAGFLYMLDRRGGHVDNDGLLVHTLTPKAGSPLSGLPANTEFGPPGTGTIPTSAVIAQWDMLSEYPNGFTFPVGANDNAGPTPYIALTTASAQALGMTNSYTPCGNNCTGSVDGEDITSTNGGTDPSLMACAWRVRGNGKKPKNGNGWNTAAPEYTQGAQFLVSTVGYQNIIFQFDWYTTAQAVRNLQVRYTTNYNSSNPSATTWANIGPVYTAPSGGAYYPQITINFENVSGVANNPNFGVQLVSAYDPTYTGAGAPTYTAATLNSSGAPMPINNTSGNWRFDEIVVAGTPIGVTTPLKLSTETTGLINPDGILAYVPNSYPLKILYVDKTLNGDYAFPTTEQCGASPVSGKINHDTSYVRVATSTDSVHWTDQGAVNGLNDPTNISYSTGLPRYVSDNGTLIKLSNGNYGLFFGAGNCLDGDSDAFHAILYAESNGSDLTHWTIVNGINNPIASVNTITATDPVTNQPVTVPSTAPVVGATQNWFSGRVYGPQAAVSNTSTVNLIFAGYSAAYSNDISSYRTIGQVQLSVANGIMLP